LVIILTGPANSLCLGSGLPKIPQRKKTLIFDSRLISKINFQERETTINFGKKPEKYR
tara:strand:- start:13215 stop:13388 length:174 start_codon:yes stop_codon:yes gene_type:complete